MAVELFTISLPSPPSVNNLFVNNRRGGRFPSARYKTWKAAALQSLWTVRLPATIETPVAIDITVSTKCRLDLDNVPKALLDFLVQQRIILNDNRAIVRRLSLGWSAEIPNVRISIYAHE